MNKYNNPRLSGTVVTGTGMDHPVRPHVIVGNTDMGYVKGDLVDANSIEEIHVELDTKIKDETKARKDADKKIQDQLNFLMSNDNLDDTINTFKEMKDFLNGYKDTTTLAKELKVLEDKIEKIELKLNGTSKVLKDATYDINSNTLGLIFSDGTDSQTFVIDLKDVYDKNDLTVMPESQLQSITDNMSTDNTTV